MGKSNCLNRSNRLSSVRDDSDRLNCLNRSNNLIGGVMRFKNYILSFVMSLLIAGVASVAGGLIVGNEVEMEINIEAVKM